MQGLIAAASLLLAFAASKVSAAPLLARQAPTTDCNISTYQLVSDIPVFTPPFTDILYPNVYYANNSAYIGQIRYAEYSEPLIISAEGSFLSQHQAPTGFVSAYVYPGETQPLQFTIPHGAIIPEGASAQGFNFTGNLWGVNGTTNAWVACPIEFAADNNWTVAQIWYQGGAPLHGCAPLNLTKYIYGHPGTDAAY
jgi:hypothetical protein